MDRITRTDTLNGSRNAKEMENGSLAAWVTHTWLNGMTQPAYYAAVAAASWVLFSSCTSAPQGAGAGDREPAKYRVWRQAPPVTLEAALAKAFGYIRESGVNMSNGYVLEVSRGGASWWFDFRLLPLSPDYGIVVRVHDSGRITNGL